jgi:hypothetical protein
MILTGDQWNENQALLPSISEPFSALRAGSFNPDKISLLGDNKNGKWNYG